MANGLLDYFIKPAQDVYNAINNNPTLNQASNAVEGAAGNVATGIGNLGDFAAEDVNSVIDTLGQIPNAIRGKPLVNPKPLSPSAEQGGQIAQGVLMGGGGELPAITKAAPDAITAGADALKTATQDAANSVRAAGDLQPGFVRIRPEDQPLPPINTSASVKMMITKADEANLSNLGYSQSEINQMKPADAGNILNNKIASTSQKANPIGVGSADTNLIRDKRFKQGTDNPNAYKPSNTNLPPVESNPMVSAQPPSPLNPNAEQFGEQGQQSAGQSGQPATNQGRNAPSQNQRTYPYDSNDPNTAFTPDELATNAKRPLTFSKNGIENAQELDQAHATLNGYKINSDDPMDQLRGIQQQKKALSDQTQAIYAEKGGTINKDTLANNIANRFFVNGEFRGSEQSQASSYIDDLYNRATGNVNVGIGGTSPTGIPGTVAGKMKSIANDDAYKTFDKPEADWTPGQKSSRYGRDAINDELSAKYSDAKQLNNDLSDMYNAEPSLKSAANKDINAKNTQARQPVEPQKPRMSVGEKILTGGFITSALTSAADVASKAGFNPAELVRGGVAGFENQFNKSANKQIPPYGVQDDVANKQDKGYYANQNQIHANSIPDNNTIVNTPDKYGNYPVANPQTVYDKNNNPVTLDRSTYLSKKKSLDDQINLINNIGGDPVEKARLQTQSDDLKRRWDSQGDIDKSWKNVQDVSSYAAKVKNDAKGLSDDLLQKTTFDQLSSINNGQYRVLNQDISKLAQLRGIKPEDIWRQQDANALLSFIDRIAKNNSDDWNRSLRNLTGETGAAQSASSGSSYQPQSQATPTPDSPLPKIHFYGQNNQF